MYICIAYEMLASLFFCCIGFAMGALEIICYGIAGALIVGAATTGIGVAVGLGYGLATGATSLSFELAIPTVIKFAFILGIAASNIK